jgi:hypothetical protein
MSEMQPFPTERVASIALPWFAGHGREMAAEVPLTGLPCGVGRELAEKRPLSKNTQRHE